MAHDVPLAPSADGDPASGALAEWDSPDDLIRELTDWALAVEIGPGRGREPELERQHLQWRRIDLTNRADRYLGRLHAHKE